MECFWGAWGYFEGCLCVCVCFAGIAVVFCSDLGGKHGLNKIKEQRINKLMLLFYFVICSISIFGYTN